MVDLVKILKTKNGPWEAFRALLLGVCRKFPASDSKPKVVLVNGSWDENTEISVSLQGFLLLEAAEEAMQSTEQDFKLLHVDFLHGELLYALGSRLARQQGKDLDTRVVVQKGIVVRHDECALALSSIMKNSKSVNIGGCLFVCWDLKRNGWAALGQALSWQLHDVPHIDVGFRSFAVSATKQDLRAVWEGISLTWRFSQERAMMPASTTFDKLAGEAGWEDLRRFVGLETEIESTSYHSCAGLCT